MSHKLQGLPYKDPRLLDRRQEDSIRNAGPWTAEPTLRPPLELLLPASGWAVELGSLQRPSENRDGGRAARLCHCSYTWAWNGNGPSLFNPVFCCARNKIKMPGTQACEWPGSVLFQGEAASSLRTAHSPRTALAFANTPAPGNAPSRGLGGSPLCSMCSSTPQVDSVSPSAGFTCFPLNWRC